MNEFIYIWLRKLNILPINQCAEKNEELLDKDLIFVIYFAHNRTRVLIV